MINNRNYVLNGNIFVVDSKNNGMSSHILVISNNFLVITNHFLDITQNFLLMQQDVIVTIGNIKLTEWAIFVPGWNIYSLSFVPGVKKFACPLKLSNCRRYKKALYILRSGGL